MQELFQPSSEPSKKRGVTISWGERARAGDRILAITNSLFGSNLRRVLNPGRLFRRDTETSTLARALQRRRWRERQLDQKSGPFSQTIAARADPAAVHIDDGFADRETQTQTLALGVDLFEGVEDLLEKLRFNTDAAIADLNADAVLGGIVRAH